MKKATASFLLFTIFLCLSSTKLSAGANETTYKFWVELKDKTGTPYSILKPWDFLSERSLARRRKNGFSICIQDLPVSPVYVNSVKEMGLKVLLTSRWMNAILVQTKDSLLAATLSKTNYVKKVTLMGYWSRSRSAAGFDPETTGQFESMDYFGTGHIDAKNQANPEEYNDGYGMGWDQVKMSNTQVLHKRGFRGKGVWIAVLDAGFYQANVLGAFDSLRANNQIIGSADFVDRDGNVYNDDDHGTHVLGCMAANVPGIMVGTAPDASYLLLRTEDARSEFPSEEAQWLAGAEYADSMGVDLISSSLGYTEFDKSEFGHTYAELNGHTALITLAANMAYERGIIMVNSAGNEGDGEWGKIGAPADAVGVIAVAAVDKDGIRAGFSSMGPTYDKRMKPDLAAMGKKAIIAGTSGYFYGSNGTSYSAPILAGSIASFFQMFSTKTASEIRSLVCMSAKNYLQPDSFLGFGIPDFELAIKLSENTQIGGTSSNPFYTWPTLDTLHADFELKTNVNPVKKYYYELKSDGYSAVSSGVISKQESLVYITRLRFKKKGWYRIRITDDIKIWERKIYFEPKKD